jgi:hypothetical protein
VGDYVLTAENLITGSLADDDVAMSGHHVAQWYYPTDGPYHHAAATCSGGLSHCCPEIVVDHVPPESIRAATHDIACGAFEVHVFAVVTCAIN